MPFGVKESDATLNAGLETFPIGGDHYIIVGRVVAASIDDRIYREVLSRLLIVPVYHIGAKEGKYAGKGTVIG